MMFDVNKYTLLARQAVSEGCVLLKNDNHVLPLKTGARIASFGRSQFNYYKSGTGSGGLVNTAYEVSILEALKKCGHIDLDQTILDIYEAWIAKNPFDSGAGWATEPWCQKEMPITEEIVKNAANRSDVALLTIGRTAGEDRDNTAAEGSYLLSVEESRLIEIVCKYFDKTVVLLNTGNIIDMKWVQKYNPSAVMYVWQGGQEGGNGVVDVLTGRTGPSGKLADTIAVDINDYPSGGNFGNRDHNIYEEDIYVGYRYFETFAKDKVMYPFGYGLSYTEFSVEKDSFVWDGKNVNVRVRVTNVGNRAGKEVVQLYLSQPQGKMGKASRVLCGFTKTKELMPGECEILEINCSNYYLASYDDSGVSGYKSCYVLERGLYTFYVGNSVRCSLAVGTILLNETEVIERLSPAMSPVVPFERFRAVTDKNGIRLGMESVPGREYDLWERINKNRPGNIPYKGDLGYKLCDVKNGMCSMETFISQIPLEQLTVMLRGEGMNSPKVTPGTGGAFGGLTETLKAFGIPVVCCTDGPCGLRMDVGTLAFSLPNGTALACSFNESLSTQLFELLGLEMRRNKIDVLLGPGINLHRNPLNGRNFEYFSEDPFLTGKMAAAQLKGMHKHKVTGTLKHFACNNQEYCRHTVNGIISERALRELYLKCFEIPVKEAGAYCIMSSYGPINGLWTASNYDLLTTILRKEWGYQGLVMSDWWAKGNEEGEDGSMQENAAMVRSQNDMFMVVTDSASNSNNDNLPESIGTNKLTVGEVQRSVANILRVIMNAAAMERENNCEPECYRDLYKLVNTYETPGNDIVVDIDKSTHLPIEEVRMPARSRTKFLLHTKKTGLYNLTISMKSISIYDLSQMSLSVFKEGRFLNSASIQGMDRDTRRFVFELECHQEETRVEFFVSSEDLVICECVMERKDIWNERR